MKKRSTMFASTVAAAAVVLGIGSVAWASFNHKTHDTIHLIAGGGQHSAHMSGPPSLGDQDAFNEPLSDQGDHLVGHSGGSCTVVSFTDGSGEANCAITLSLPGGEILLGGLQPLSPAPFTMAVIGGTGQYHDAGGQADVARRPDHRRDVLIHLN